MAHRPGVSPILRCVVNLGVWLVRRRWRVLAKAYFWALAPLTSWLASQR